MPFSKAAVKDDDVVHITASGMGSNSGGTMQGFGNTALASSESAVICDLSASLICLQVVCS